MMIGQTQSRGAGFPRVLFVIILFWQQDFPQKTEERRNHCPQNWKKEPGSFLVEFAGDEVYTDEAGGWKLDFSRDL